jgi:putative copper resistance protein D
MVGALRKEKHVRRRYLIALGLVLLGLGVALGLEALFSRSPTFQGVDARRNPFPPTPDSLAEGARIYRDNCAVCHGTDGRGDGPLAATLYPRPVDFWAHFGSGHTHPDGRLYFWISSGMPGTGMPGFKDRLSDADRWHVINFIKNEFTPVDR